VAAKKKGTGTVISLKKNLSSKLKLFRLFFVLSSFVITEPNINTQNKNTRGFLGCIKLINQLNQWINMIHVFDRTFFFPIPCVKTNILIEMDQPHLNIITKKSYQF